MSLNLYVGNIVDDSLLELADAIVNPTNPMMKMGMGVSMAIFQKDGVDELENYTANTFNISYEDVSRKNEMKETEIRITPGFNIPCDIIFAQSPNLEYYDSDKYEFAHEKLMQTYQNILDVSIERNYKTILLPSLGTGHYGFTHEDVAKDVIALLKDYCGKNLINIIFVLFNEDTKIKYEKYI